MKKTYAAITATLLSACLLCGCSQTGQEADVSTKNEASTTAADAVKLVADIPTTQYFTDEAVNEADIETIVTAGINTPSAMNGQPWHFSVITDAAVLQQISDGMGGGMGFGGGTPPAGAPMSGGAMPEGMEPPVDMEQPPEPAVTDFPDGEKVTAPDGTTPPEGMELPEGFTPPEGNETMTPPAGAFGGGSGTGGLSKAGLTDAPLAIVISCTAGSELDAGLACQNMSVTAQLLGYGTKIISSPTMALNGEKQDEYRELLGIPDNQSAVAILLIGYEDTSIDDTVDGYTGATARNPMDEMVTFVAPSQDGQ